MGYKLNSEAYILFTQIEVAVKEFLITIIKDKGVNEWTRNFLGKVHLDSIKEIGKRIYEANEKQIQPSIEDIYASKMYKELKVKKESFKGGDLLHPFYYLGWSDLIGAIGKTPNFEIIGDSIGNLNRNVILNALTSLSYLRNDIAHSRYISNESLIFIRSSYDQISLVIPNFHQLSETQYSEDSIDFLLSSLSSSIDQLESSSMIDIKEIVPIKRLIDKIINSFWVNFLFTELIEQVMNLKGKVEKYHKYREMPGGLLKIQQWKVESQVTLSNIKKIINERKI